MVNVPVMQWDLSVIMSKYFPHTGVNVPDIPVCCSEILYDYCQCISLTTAVNVPDIRL